MTDPTDVALADWERDLLIEQANKPRLQLVVLHADHTFMYYPIDAAAGWKIDGPSRCIIIGKGVPRTYVPLDGIRSFSIEPVAGASS